MSRQLRKATCCPSSCPGPSSEKLPLVDCRDRVCPRARSAHRPRAAGAPSSRRSVRLLREFRHEQPDPDRFYTALAATRSAQLASLHRPDGELLLDVGGGPGLLPRRRSRRPAPPTSRSTPTWGSCPGSGEVATSHASLGQRHAAAVPRRLRSTSATPPTCSSTCPTRGGWPTRCCGSPARWHRLRQLHGLVRPVGRPRDRAVALPRRGVAPGAGTGAGTGTSRRTSSVSRSSPSRSRDGLRWARSQTRPTWSTCCPATTRGGPAGCCACPLLREVVTWNLVIVLRKR